MQDKLLGGRYQVVKILANGGFSQTYVAEDSHRPGNPKCVVKHLLPTNNDLSCLQNVRRLFRSEAETLEKLGNHDQIPRLLAYFEENQEFFLVQDFVEGYPLSAELEVTQPWSESKVYQLLQEVLEILVFVHSHGVIHRDIKPNNLIKRQHDNKLVLVDFGSVKQAWRQVVTTHGKTCSTFAIGIPATIAIGTPEYMPIEQERGRPRPNSDIYALGMIGIKALTGLYPIQFLEDFDTGEIIWRHQAHVSDALASVLTKMVRYHFKDRYQTAAEALQELQLVNCLDSNVYPLVQQPSSVQPTVIITHPSQDRTFVEVQEVTDSDSLLSQNVISLEESANLGKKNVDLQERYPSSPANHNHLRIWAGITATLISIVAGYVIYWQPRASLQKTLEQIETLKAEGRYEECRNQATTVPQDSPFYTDAQALFNECQLAQAMLFAADGNFKAAINEAGKIPQDAVYYQDAQQFIDQWSLSILEIATNKYNSGNLNDAIAIALAIPEISPFYQKAQGTVKQWNREWEKNDSYLKAAKSAINEGKWQNAISEANKVIDTPYWQQKIEPITQKAQSKIAQSKIAVTSQPKRATLPPRTIPRRQTRLTSLPPRTIPRRQTRLTSLPPRTIPKRLTRTTPKRLTRITPRRLTRSAPPKRSYQWTTETVQ